MKVATTTIQVSDRTRQQIEVLKKKYRLFSCDAVVQKFVRKKLNTPTSLAAAFPDLGQFERNRESQ